MSKNRQRKKAINLLTKLYRYTFQEILLILGALLGVILFAATVLPELNIERIFSSDFLSDNDQRKDFLLLTLLLIFTLFMSMNFLLKYLQVDRKSFEEKQLKTHALTTLTEDDKKDLLSALEQNFINQASDGIIMSVYRTTEKKWKNFRR